MTAKNKLRAGYIAIWGVTAIYALISEVGVLPTDYAASDATTQYCISLLSIITAIGGTFLALRLPATSFVRRQLCQDDETLARKAYLKWSACRIAVAAVAVWTNTVLYYAADTEVESIKYCLLIALIATVFCRPSSSEFLSLRTKNAPKTER